MNTTLRHLLLSTLLAASPAALPAAEAAKNCGCDCCKGKDVCCCHTPAATDAAKKAATATPRHALRGVVTGVLADKSALLVKHEEIPGVMRAMTMMFKVDAATVKAVKNGDAITGLMSRRDDEWILEEVKVAAGSARK